MLLALLFPQSLTSDLDKILDAPQFKGALTAAYVTTLDGKTIYGRNADTRVMPASNQKLLTCAYALHTLGDSYIPETKIWKESDRLVIHSTGDPMLTHKQLLQARQKLGITTSLPVHLDQAYAPGIPPTWEFDDLPNKYAAPITAFTVDRGSFELWTDNGKLFFLPEAYGTRTMHIDRAGAPRVDYMPAQGFALVTGSLPASRTRLDTLALPNPEKAAASILGGPVLRATSLPSRAPDHVIQGPPLPVILKECLTRSDNNIAEHLLLMAALKEGPLPDRPYGEASRRLKRFLTTTVGLDPSDVNPYDGSGMSRHNNVTAKGVANLLAWTHDKWGEKWTGALAMPGQTGTLSARLQGSTFRGKTGSLDLASALSGYVKAADGQTLVVSLIMNHYMGSAAQIRAIQDAFIKRLEAGTVLASWKVHHESYLAHPRHRTPDRNRTHRPDHDSMAARSGPNRRDESTHARLSGKRRVAVRHR